MSLKKKVIRMRKINLTQQNYMYLKMCIYYLLDDQKIRTKIYYVCT